MNDRRPPSLSMNSWRPYTFRKNYAHVGDIVYANNSEERKMKMCQMSPALKH